MKDIVLASNNKHKIEEIKDLLKDFNVNIQSLKDLNLGEPVENGTTFLENAIIKAKYVFEKTGLPTLADDSGFCLEALNGFPAISSARFIKAVGGEEQAFEILNKCLDNRSKKAFFITNLAFIYKNKNNEVIIKNFEGRIDGSFIYPSRGEFGFAFDHVFIPDGYNKTFAEIPEVKAKIGHRAIASKEFLKFFKSIERNN